MRVEKVKKDNPKLVLRRQGLYKEVSEILTNNTCSNCKKVSNKEFKDKRMGMQQL
jgi:hypothetical protein